MLKDPLDVSHSQASTPPQELSLSLAVWPSTYNIYFITPKWGTKRPPASIWRPLATWISYVASPTKATMLAASSPLIRSEMQAASLFLCLKIGNAAFLKIYSYQKSWKRKRSWTYLMPDRRSQLGPRPLLEAVVLV
jgi:hypothetical protein